MPVKIKDVKVHPQTGYMEVDVVSVKKNENSVIEGPMKTYGIDVHILQSKYAGNVDLWLAAVKGDHETHSGHHETLSEKLLSYKGKEL